MYNSFKPSGEDIELRMRVLADRLNGVPSEAIVIACRRFEDGEVEGQSKRNAPTVPEFVQEAKKQADFLRLRASPRIPSPDRPRGPAPFEIRMSRDRATYMGRQVLHENVSYERWQQMSKAREVPVGAVWVASLGVVYAPAITQEQTS